MNKGIKTSRIHKNPPNKTAGRQRPLKKYYTRSGIFFAAVNIPHIDLNLLVYTSKRFTFKNAGITAGKPL